MEQNTITNTEFNLFRDFIYEHAGIRLSDEKKPLVISRLSKRLRHYSLISFQDYFDLMIASGRDQEQQVAIDLLTTNETYFFREPKHFDFLANEILVNRDSDKIFRVWSAASSTGEEAYSIAMLLDDKLKNDPWEVFGSDINQTVIQQARRGLYLQDRIDGIPKAYLQNYCFKGKDEYEGKLLINEKLRKKVSFDLVNLTMPLTNLGQFQLIFIRNVMIYFDLETKNKIIKQIVQKLAHGGYLFVGHSESLERTTDSLIQICPAVYQKI
jgi:chemotaxis protein methyltransferase CheR